MTIADQSLRRQVAELERSVAMLETLVYRESTRRSTAPIAGRLWRFTLNSTFTDYEADADLLTLSGDDTGRDITVADPIGLFGAALNGHEGWCIEQLDTDGARWYVVIQMECP